MHFMKIKGDEAEVAAMKSRYLCLLLLALDALSNSVDPIRFSWQAAKKIAPKATKKIQKGTKQIGLPRPGTKKIGTQRPGTKRTGGTKRIGGRLMLE